MLITKLKVLELFGNTRALKLGRLNERDLKELIATWDKAIQEKADRAINELIDEGFIGQDENWFQLLDKGYQFLKENYGRI